MSFTYRVNSAPWNQFGLSKMPKKMSGIYYRHLLTGEFRPLLSLSITEKDGIIDPN
jgi:hypothetical protein